MIVVRDVSDAMAAYGCDVERARAQHENYIAQFPGEVVRIPADPALPDCCFVEDTAVIENGRALITRMGWDKRRPETPAVRDTLRDLGLDIVEMDAPATVDGGDVLRIGTTTWVGLSARTNEEGVRGLESFLGRPCIRVPVTRCLHLKSAVTEYTEGRVLLNPRWIDPAPFGKHVATTSPNAVKLPDSCLVGDPSLDGTFVDTSEFEKADGSLTCLSLVVSF